MNQNHSAFEPLRSTTDGSSSAFQMKPGNALRMSVIIDRYKSCELKLSSLPFYEPLLVNDFAPVNRQKRYRYILALSLPYQTETYSYSAGNYVGTSHFVWRTPPCADFNASKQVMSKIDKQIPMYHTRMMRREFQSRFEGLVSTKPVVMQEMYRFLTGDSSQVVNDISKEVKARLDILLQTGDSENLVDLRELNRGKPVKFDTFFDGVQAFINRNALEAVDERRHEQHTHMALAISVHDLREQVSKNLPEDTAIPSENYFGQPTLISNQPFIILGSSM